MKVKLKVKAKLGSVLSTEQRLLRLRLDFLSLKSSLHFQKSIVCYIFLFQRGEIFKIKSVDAIAKPELYKLEDLLGAEVKGHFYAKQLRLAPNADDPEFVFEVETVIKKRKVRGVEEILVKYLYYPGKN